jgi:hypothetical protein
LSLAGHGGNDRENCKQGAPDNSWFHGIFLRLWLIGGRNQRRDCVFFASPVPVLVRNGQGNGRYRMQDAMRDPLK